MPVGASGYVTKLDKLRTCYQSLQAPNTFSVQGFPPNLLRFLEGVSALVAGGMKASNERRYVAPEQMSITFWMSCGLLTSSRRRCRFRGHGEQHIISRISSRWALCHNAREVRCSLHSVPRGFGWKKAGWREERLETKKEYNRGNRRMDPNPRLHV